MKAGLFTIPASDYLSDSGNDVPTLNSTVARILLAESPLHAKWAHPKLSPLYRPEESEAFDLGRCAHAYLLEGRDAFAIVDASDWRTKDAKAARDAARLTGQIPMLARQWANVQAMIDACKESVEWIGGDTEQTIVWSEGDVWLRARLDWLSFDRREIRDYKTTGQSAHPDQWARTMFSMGHDIQSAFYARGIRALFGKEPEFVFIVQETCAPYAISRIGLAPDALALAEKKVDRAVAMWGECLRSGVWPAYPSRTIYADAPPWEVARWEAAGALAEGLAELETWEKGDRA